MKVHVSPILSALIPLAFLSSCSSGTTDADPAPDQLAFAEPSNQYGDDTFLDLLWEACDVTGGRACDVLWERSPIGSDYESFASTCGGRFPASKCLSDSGSLLEVIIE